MTLPTMTGQEPDTALFDQWREEYVRRILTHPGVPAEDVTATLGDFGTTDTMPMLTYVGESFVEEFLKGEGYVEGWGGDSGADAVMTAFAHVHPEVHTLWDEDTADRPDNADDVYNVHTDAFRDACTEVGYVYLALKRLGEAAADYVRTHL